MLSDEQIVLSARPIGGLFDDLAVHYQSDDIVKFARAIEAEVRKDDESLIRQMLEALETCYEDDDGEQIERGFDAGKVAASTAAARARLPDPDLSKLTERGAVAWAGVGAQALREGKNINPKEGGQNG